MRQPSADSPGSGSHLVRVVDLIGLHWRSQFNPCTKQVPNLFLDTIVG